MSLWQDIRFAVRLLVKDRWFTLAAAGALALGIGSNATVFTLVNAVLIRGLPFPEPARIMAISTENNRGQRMGVSDEDFKDVRAQSHSFSDLVASLNSVINVSDDERTPERYQGSYVSWNLFRLLGQQPMIGRNFAEGDDRPGTDPVVMLGYNVWQNRFNRDPAVLGRTIRVNSRVVTVIGVMPAGMQFPNNVDLWIPRVLLPPGSFLGRGSRNFNVIGRLAPNVTIDQARTELAAIGSALAEAYPTTNKDLKPTMIPFEEAVNGGPIRLVFLTLMGAVGFVLLIACANVANLLLARSVARSREISIRFSLGATRWRIVRQLLVESVLLAFISGAGGLAFAVAGVRLFDRATVDVGKPYWMYFTFDPIVFAFVAATCLGAAVIFGLAPALHVSKTDVNEVLKEGGRSGTGGLRAKRWVGALVVSEIILTLVLLSGAGFMMRSFLKVYSMEVGIDTSRLVTMQIYLPLTKYPEPGPRRDLYQRFEDRLANVPGLQASAVATSMPVGGGFGRGLALDGKMPAEGQRPPNVVVVAVGDRYFDTTGIPIRKGRTFRRDEGLPGHGAAIVNERFVALHSPKQDPIGRQIKLIGDAPSEWVQIVGVVPDVRQQGGRQGQGLPDPVAYVPLRSSPERTSVVLFRTPLDTAKAVETIRGELRAIEPDLPLFDVRTLDEALARNRWEFVIFGSMFAVFAGIALVLSAVGLYAVTAYSVTQRTQEIGIRMALGALPSQILWLVLRRSLIQIAIGLPIGMAGAYGVGRLLQSLLVQTSASDPVTLVSIALVLISVAVVACLWPARRAARFDPMLALRGD